METSSNAPILVWAKYSRYPWWPAFLTGKDSDGQRQVCFFGKFDYSMVPEKSVKPFEESPRFDKKDQKNKTLQSAISTAKKIKDGDSTIEVEMQRIKSTNSTNNSQLISHKSRKVYKPTESVYSEDSKMDEDFEESKAAQSVESSSEKKLQTSLLKVQKTKSENLLMNRLKQMEQIAESFDSSLAKLQSLAESIHPENANLPREIDDFCELFNKLLEKDSMEKLVHSNAGKLLTKVKGKFEGIAISEEVSQAGAALAKLLTKVKKEILMYFFTKESNQKEEDLLVTRSLVQSLVDSKSECKCQSTADTKRNLIAQPTTSVQPERIRRANSEQNEFEGPKIDVNTRIKVFRKVRKILGQSCGKKLSRSQCDELTDKLVGAIRKNSSNVIQYKQMIIYFVKRKNEIEELFANLSNVDALKNNDFLTGQILSVITK